MIPIETIKELAVECGFSYAGRNPVVVMCSVDELNKFSNAIEDMTIDRCANVVDDLLNTNTDGTIRDGVKQVRIYSGFSKDIQALKNKE